MEVIAAAKSRIDCTTRDCHPSSVFDSDPSSFSELLSNPTFNESSGSRGNIKNQWRLDAAHSAAAPHFSSVKNTPDPARICEPDSVEEVDFSQFGHCAPLATQPATLSISIEKMQDNRRERLLRFLELQQGWYDAHQADLQQAFAFLDIIEHQQIQWLQTNIRPASIRG